MTKEEAIEIIEGRNFSCIECIDRSEECCQALEMAIKVLEQPDGDLISRDYVLSKFKEQCDRCGKYKENNGVICRCCALDDAIDYVEDAPSAEKTANKININEYVKVKLTDYGKEIFYHQYDNINKTYGKEIIKPSYPTVDNDGYTSFQLWYFMNLYGRYIDMGVQNVIEPLEIVFESAEKPAEWISHAEDDLAISEFQCSNCDYWLDDKTKYCPNCGRRMKGENNV